jgi:hypothetical protein
MEGNKKRRVAAHFDVPPALRGSSDRIYLFSCEFRNENGTWIEAKEYRDEDRFDFIIDDDIFFSRHLYV